MTQRQIQQYSKKLEANQIRYEKKYFMPIYRALIKMQKPVIDALLAGKSIDEVLLQLPVLIDPKPLSDVLYVLYRYVGAQAAQYEMSNFKEVYSSEIEGKKWFGFSEIWDSIMRGVWEQIGAAKVTNMSLNQILRLRRKLIDAKNDPELDLFRLAKQLQQPNVDWRRAKLIARTETGQAAGLGQNQAAKKTGFLMVKRWITILDGRERQMPQNSSDHRKMNKVKIAMSEKFSVPSKNGNDLMEFAHDPEGPADQVCNCRCKTVYEGARDARGRLIRT